MKDHEGLINWIKTSDLSTKRTVLNLKGGNSIYLEPSSASPILAKVNENVTLELLDAKKIDDWVKVYSKVGDIEGFIKATDLWGIK